MKNTKGFTLIELLVVITIIGILATGASTVYTSAQQKARDSIRQTDLMAIKSSIEQSYGDQGAYLLAADANDTTNKTVYAIKDADNGLVGAGYMTKFPSDPKSLNADDSTLFVYMYGSGQDPNNFVPGQVYELSANFENGGNASKEEADAEDDDTATPPLLGDDTRWEIGVNMEAVDTAIDEAGVIRNQNIYNGDITIDPIQLDPAAVVTP